MLGATFVASRPRGLQRLVLASGLVDKELSMRSMRIRRGELPSDVIKVMEKHEMKSDYDSPAYQDAQMVFNKHSVCREESLLPELVPAFKNLHDDKTVYGTMHPVAFPRVRRLLLALSLAMALASTQNIEPASF